MNISEIKTIGYCCILGTIFVAIDMLSFKEQILCTKYSNTVFVDLNLALELYSSIISQFTYSLFTGIPTTVVGGFICENFVLIQELSRQISNKIKGNDKNAIVTNVLFCIALSTIIFSVVSLILTRFK